MMPEICARLAKLGEKIKVIKLVAVEFEDIELDIDYDYYK